MAELRRTQAPRCGGAGDRPVGADARRRAAGCAGPRCCAPPSSGTTAAAPPNARRSARARAAAARDRRQPRDAGLHRAQAAVDARARARAVRAHRARAAAQGLAALRAQRRSSRATCRTPRARCGWTWRARDWSDELLAACGLDARADAAAGGGQRSRGATQARAGAALGPGGRRAIAGGGGDNAASAVGMGIVDAGAGLRLARHLGRDLRRRRALRAQSGAGACMPSAMRCRGAGTRCR